MFSGSLIIGGGLSGLSLGLKLSGGGRRVLILESEREPGGMARSYPVERITFDFGPHVFRSTDKSLIDWVRSLNRMNEYQSKPGTHKYGQVFDHVIPVITWENMSKLPKPIRDKAMKEAKLFIKKQSTDRHDNFEEAIESQVGPTLCREFFSEYSRKWWGVDTKLLSAELAPTRLRIGDDSSYSHITTGHIEPRRELYPAEGGYGAITEALMRKISDLRNIDVKTDSRVTDIHCDDGKVSGVVINGEEELPLEGDVYSTAPLTDVSAMLGKQASLKYRADICVFLVFKRGDFKEFEKSWLYFPEKDIAFGRLCNTGHFSKNNERKGLIGVTAEITCFRGDSTWRTENDELVSRVLDSLESLEFIKDRTVVAAQAIKEGSAYPLLTVDYNEGRQELITEIKERASNLKLVGRTGAFQYLNSDAALSLSR